MDELEDLKRSFNKRLDKEEELRREEDQKNADKIADVLKQLNEAKNGSPKGVTELQRQFVLILLSLCTLFSGTIWNINSNLNRRIEDTKKTVEDSVGSLTRHTNSVGHTGVLERLSSIDTNIDNHHTRIKAVESKAERVRSNVIGHSTALYEKVRNIERFLFSNSKIIKDSNEDLEKSRQDWWLNE